MAVRIFRVQPSIPAHGKLFVVSKDLPAMLKLELNSQDDAANGSLSKALSPEERGRKVYQSKCKLCHGAELAGQPPAVPSLINVCSRLGADEVRAIVTRGRGQMPAISTLSDAALDSLMAYVLHPERAPASAPEESAGNAVGGTSSKVPPRKAPLSKQLRFHVCQ